MGIDTGNIFSIKTFEEFQSKAIEIFHYQASNNPVYKHYLESLKTDLSSIYKIDQIPFLPIEFFKTHSIVSSSDHSSSGTIFTSSGTTGQVTSKHIVKDISLYEQSFKKCFELFYGNISDYCFLALLPSYLEREGSSLVYMTDTLINESKHIESGFYLHNYDELILKLQKLADKKQKTILLGVTYALLDLIDRFPLFKFPKGSLIVMETGGMKGKRKEMVREELHEILSSGFGVETIHSEYGMTELLSQAYSKGKGVYNCPPWMHILIRDANDPFTYLEDNRAGGINVIDLANLYSCSFIATQDLGKKTAKNSFEVLGRFDNSDIRGCNLMVQ